MNIIEHVWNQIKYCTRGEVFDDKDQLWRRIKKEWDSLPKEFISRLYQSMPDRIQALREAEGGHTKY